MALKDDLEAEVAKIFREQWSTRDGQVVPTPGDIKLGNDAVKLRGTVLYADLSESTAMVQSKRDSFSAEVYKTFLHCAAKIIKEFGGVITAYDGDRIMAVYLGNFKNTNAVKSSLKIHSARRHIIQPALTKQYPNESFTLKHVVGIDTSDLFVARTGVRGDNDLVWVGRAANWAAKLSDLPNSHATWISAAVHDKMNDTVKKAGDGQNMWEQQTWTAQDDARIYRSDFWWRL
ncbi:adenylate/guanylate cyclase domain-containing protein [Sphingomonas sp. CFBP 13720]|uniref:adenylate/guanylate cyclase domain-containing protein n=1 Tax=Sphingomonas sp. CFBP 13720 TaxID=2775302 RepID=UPI0017876FDB|nr:adenylate/guanylate cyclase domain-containing protein [Sphingomonas sp. CFBP 13720]MBD8679255.1 adenylate/guanylate cyclase domain-containing protein [Sphingomonas sp. CFBP 13720]